MTVITVSVSLRVLFLAQNTECCRHIWKTLFSRFHQKEEDICRDSNNLDFKGTFGQG